MRTLINPPRRSGVIFRWILLLLLVLGPLFSEAHGGPVEIIVNPAQSAIAIDRTLLRAIFSLRLRAWPGGTPIRVFVLSDEDPLNAQFCREILGTYPYVLREAWDRMVFTGTALAPTVVKTEKEMRERVENTPGAIGYIGGGSSRAFPLPETVESAGA
jgi:ABC-type phosphate transport system substrate-binding protein